LSTITLLKSEAMHQMRQSGASLQQIGNSFGISRERVRQLLTQYYGSTAVQDLLNTSELARLAGCSWNYIDKLERGGIIQPEKVVGWGRRQWPPQTVDIITSYNDNHRCPICGQPVPSNRWVYCCQSCRLEANRYKNQDRYKNRSEEEKKKHQEAVQRWQAKHPEQARQIQQRKGRKYWARKSRERYQTTQYVIWKRCPIPLGTVVRLVSLSRGKARVEWGEKTLDIPFGCVRAIDKC